MHWDIWIKLVFFVQNMLIKKIIINCPDNLNSYPTSNALITWSCKVMWQTKATTSLLTECLWHQIWKHGNLPWWAPTHKVNDKLKPLLQYLWPLNSVGRWHNLRGSFPKSHIKQNGNLHWRAPIHKITWSFDHVVLRDHVINLNYYIFTNTVLIATRLGRMVIKLEELLITKSFNT